MAQIHHIQNQAADVQYHKLTAPQKYQVQDWYIVMPYHNITIFPAKYLDIDIATKCADDYWCFHEMYTILY